MLGGGNKETNFQVLLAPCAGRQNCPPQQRELETRLKTTQKPGDGGQEGYEGVRFENEK